MRTTTIGLALGIILSAGSASAYDAEDPHNCGGLDWNDKRAVVVSKVTASPRVNFVKSPYDDDFKAASCPAATDACTKKSYLITGDLALGGRTLGDFTCISYQSPLAKQRQWTVGWLPRSALTPVAPLPSPRLSDWTGTWDQPAASIEITQGKNGKLHIVGEVAMKGAREVHTGEIDALVIPKGDTIAFADDGSIPFEKTDEGECRVRMQRIGPWLMVQDNGECGGAAVTFSALYHRIK